MWADDLFAYIDSVELSFDDEALSASAIGVDGAEGDPDAGGHFGGHNGRFGGERARALRLSVGVDESVLNRRAKNRLAAQLSRRKKKQYLSCLEARLKDLQTVSGLLDDSLAATVAQNASLRRDLHSEDTPLHVRTQTVVVCSD
jgi:hypothetical protein